MQLARTTIIDDTSLNIDVTHRYVYTKRNIRHTSRRHVASMHYGNDIVLLIVMCTFAISNEYGGRVI